MRKPSTSLVIPGIKPRNPLIAGGLMRKAGEHRKSNKALRMQENIDIRRVAQLVGQDTFNIRGARSSRVSPTI